MSFNENSFFCKTDLRFADKGNGVVVMDRVIFNQQMYALSSNKNKFKKLSEDLTKLREGQLQRYLRELKKKQFLDDATSGSQPSRLYDTNKVHKIKSNSEVSSFRPRVSSIGSFNYLSRFAICLTVYSNRLLHSGFLLICKRSSRG